MADKLFTIEYTETGITSYIIIRQDSTSYVYDENDGQFRSYASATNKFIDLTEDTNLKGVYEVTISDSNIFIDGRYLIVGYRQTGNSPDPSTDSVIAQGWALIKNNAIFESEDGISDVQDIVGRILGLTQENFYIDNAVYDGNKLTSGRIRTYTDAASVGTDSNILSTYNIAATYEGLNLLTYQVIRI